MADNPWTPRLERLTAVVYLTDPPPPPAFETRIYALCGLSAACAAGMLLLLAFLLLDMKRRQQSRWIWRTVKRPGGRYTIVNSRLCSSVLSLVNLALIIGDSLDMRSAYFQQQPGSQLLSGAWHALVPIPLVFQLWLLSWLQLQAFLISPAGGALISARVVNWASLGLGSFLHLGTIGGGIAASYLSATSWRTAINLLEALGRLQQRFGDPAYAASNVVDQVAVVALTKRSKQLGSQRIVSLLTEFSLGLTAVYLVILVNASAFVVARLALRRAGHRFASSHLDNLDATLNQPGKHGEHSFNLHLSWKQDSSVDVTRLSKASLQQLASEPARGLTGEKAAQYLALLRSAADYKLMSLWLATIATVCAIFGTWNVACNIARPGFSTGTWAVREAVITTLHWIYVVIHLIIIPYLLRSAFVNLPPSRNVQRRQKAGSKASIGGGAAGGGMVRVQVEEHVQEDFTAMGERGGGGGFLGAETRIDTLGRERRAAPRRADDEDVYEVPLEVRGAGIGATDEEEFGSKLSSVADEAIPFEWRLGPPPEKTTRSKRGKKG